MISDTVGLFEQRTISGLGCTYFLEEFEPFKVFERVMSNEMIGISATIAHWYDIRHVIQYPPVRCRVMSLKFQKFLLLTYSILLAWV